MARPPSPAREVRAGDRLVVKNEGGEFQIEVLALSQMRGPAAVAQTLYRESEASIAARAKAAAERKAMQQFAPLPERRPSKRDRRRIIQFRGRASIPTLAAKTSTRRGWGTHCYSQCPTSKRLAVPGVSVIELLALT